MINRENYWTHSRLRLMELALIVFIVALLAATLLPVLMAPDPERRSSPSQ